MCSTLTMNARASFPAIGFSVPGTDLHLDLGDSGLRAGLADALRDAIRTGRLAPGTKLPSSRALAVDLGIARNTVAECYGELIAEGWLVAKQGSGTRVARRADPRGRARKPVAITVPPSRRASGLVPGVPNLADFPRAQWLAAARRAMATAPNDALSYGDPRGRPELRAVIADYLARSRGVHADPERIVICAGFHQGLTLIAQVLRARKAKGIAIEAYGFEPYRDIIAAAGLRTPALYVDECGARTDALAELKGAAAVLLTPAHQYPTGVALHADRRARAVDWAHTTGGLILEDDYDGEFRYDRQPVGALQGLAPDRVVYFGSASKSLAPGLRLAWMVAPEEFIDEIVVAKGHVDWSSALEQLTLAEFIAEGAYDRHVRTMRLRYRRRRDQLVAAVAERSPGVRITGMAAGLQAVLDLAAGTEGSVVRKAAARGLEVAGLAQYRCAVPGPGWVHPKRDALVMGYAGPSDSAWPGALATLSAVLP
jgi:GntR family transcriptional regulator / MocR family aminotransferase